MPNLLIRDVPEDTVKALKEIAKRNGRSVQQESRMAIERHTLARAHDPAAAARRIRERFASQGRFFSDSTPLIREDRER